MRKNIKSLFLICDVFAIDMIQMQHIVEYYTYDLSHTNIISFYSAYDSLFKIFLSVKA